MVCAAVLLVAYNVLCVATAIRGVTRMHSKIGQYTLCVCVCRVEAVR